MDRRISDARSSVGRTHALAATIGAALIVLALPGLVFAADGDPPVNLTAVEGAQPVIASLSWEKPPDTEPVGYYVYAAVDANGPYMRVDSADDPHYDFAGGLSGMSYYFRVTAILNDLTESDFAQCGPVASSWTVTPHAEQSADSSVCALCHVSHNSSADMLARRELASDSLDPTALCRGCHNGRVADAANVTTGTIDSFGLPSGHSLSESATAESLVENCSSCHASHASSAENPMLLASYVNSSTVSSSGPEWCETCHDDVDSWFGSGYPSAAAPTRDASGYPVSGTWLGPETYSNGSNPHRLIPESTQTAQAGASVKRAEGDCLYCHAAHGGPNTYDGLKETFRPASASTLASDQADGTYAASCFACHGGAVPSGFTTATVDIKQFATAADSSAGHRIITSGGVLPVGAPLPCYDCHNPHGSTRDNASMLSDELGASLETSTDAGVRRFCFTCHTTSDTGNGWDSEAGAYQAVPSTATVEGIARDGGVLSLSATEGHAEGDSASCYECHGDGYGPGDRNVHNPDESGSMASAASIVLAAAGLFGDDVIAPSTVSDAGTTYEGTATIGLAAIDGPGGSGVDTTYYSLDGSATVESTSVVVPPPESSAVTHTLEYWSTDLAGNVEDTQAVSFSVAADTRAVLAFRWEPAGYATAQLRVLDSSGASIASTTLAGDAVGSVDWDVRVPVGEDYQLWCDYRELDDPLGNVIDSSGDYGTWITPVTAGETYVWWY